MLSTTIGTGYRVSTLRCEVIVVWPRPVRLGSRSTSHRGRSASCSQLARFVSRRCDACGDRRDQLGLSDQVPAKVVFLTDGRSKRIQLGKLTIALKQTSPRIMATAGTISGSIIQALRYLGKDHVTEETVKRLDRRLSTDDRKQLLKDLAYDDYDYD